MGTRSSWWGSAAGRQWLFDAMVWCVLWVIAGVMTWGIVSIVGCTAAPAKPGPRSASIDDVMVVPVVEVADAFVASPVRRLLAAVVDGETGIPADAGVRVVRPPTNCGWQGGMLPIVVPAARLPLTGSTFVAEWQLEVALSVSGVEPVREVMIMGSTKLLEEPYRLGDGCWLMVHPEWRLVPEFAPTAPPGAPLTYRPGTSVVRLQVPLATALSGTSFYLQLLVKVPESGPLQHLVSPLLVKVPESGPLQHLVSPLLVVDVGSR